VNSEELAAGTVIVGLRFQPGALGRWLGTSAPELVNGRVALEEFWGTEARRLAAIVSEGRNPEAIAQRLETSLVERMSRVREPDRAASAIFRTIGAGPCDPTEVTRRLSESLGMSARTVRRRAVEAFGYGPKTLQRILRFQGFLRATRATPTRSLAELAAVAGYADQPHLSREARQLTGMTPATVLGRLP
jgi:AraC-like DNA-binding protein